MHFTRRILVLVLMLFGLYLIVTSNPARADQAA